jgi:hypothetical protein
VALFNEKLLPIIETLSTPEMEKTPRLMFALLFLKSQLAIFKD